MEKEKLLGDIPLPKGTGKNMADATFQLFLAWKVENNIVAFGFDTTLSMTGPDKGVWVCVCERERERENNAYV